jgi:hypothetical protein
MTPKDPEIQALQDQVTKLTAIIEDLKAQTVPPTPPPAPNPTAPSAQDLAKPVEQVTSAVTSLQDQFRQFLATQSSNGEATKSPARKKHFSTTSDSEEHISEVTSLHDLMVQLWTMNPRIHGPTQGTSSQQPTCLDEPLQQGSMADEWVGGKLPPKRAAGSTRFFFVNANGIRYGALGGEMDEVCYRGCPWYCRDQVRYNHAMCA